MPKKLIIGISLALVLVGAVVLAVVFVRSRGLTEGAPTVESGGSLEGGTGSSGGTLGSSNASGGSVRNQGGTAPQTTQPLRKGGPCGDGICSEGEASWCDPDCGSEEERFRASVQASEVTPTSITIAWKTDTPSTGEVSYGATERYELGSASSKTPATTHAVKLQGLLAGRNYLLRLRVTMADGSVRELGPLNYETSGSR